MQIIRDVSDEARVQTHYKHLLKLTEARAADLERLVDVRTKLGTWFVPPHPGPAGTDLAPGIG